MKNNQVVALDVDGVLGDFETHWRECAEKITGRLLPKVSDQHDMIHRYGLTQKEVNAVWKAFHVEWGNIPLYDYASDLVLALEDMDFQVWAVTGVEECYRESRAESLAGLIPAGRIVCVGSPGRNPAATATAKANVLWKMRAMAFLDDHPANANAALSFVDISVLMNRGYQGLEAPEHGVTVIDDPMDFPSLVQTFLTRTGRINYTYY